MEENQSHQLENIYKAYCAKGEARSDLISLLALTQGSPNNETKEERDTWQQAMLLFWNLYYPSVIYPSVISMPGVKTNKVSSELTKSEIQVVLDTLENLEKSSRVSYKPDTDVPLDELFVYLHIAACRALMLKKRDSYSEEVRMVLDEAWRASRLFEGPREIPYCTDSDDDIESDYARSFVSVSGIVALELARLRRIDGKCEESLHMFAVGLSYVSTAVSAVYNQEYSITPRPQDENVPQIDIAAQELVDVFEHLRAHTGIESWRQISWDCSVISLTWEDCSLFADTKSETVTDSKGWKWDPPAFWQQAKGWAEAKLEPSEYLQEMKKSEDEQAERRLTAYFFEKETFDALPERAKEGLIEAEKAWFSTKSGRIERAFNELRIATIEILYSAIWKPLCKWLDSCVIREPRLLDFQKIRERLTQENKKPSLIEFENMLTTYAFNSFLESLQLPKNDKDFVGNFVKSELLKALKELRLQRKKAEHDIQRIWKREEVAPVFRKFLGIGDKGILQRLVKVQKMIIASQNER